MAQEVATQDSSLDIAEKPWGSANPLRGANHEDTAASFVRDYPPGTTLKQDEFDEWAQRHGLLNVPTGAPKKSDAWLAHLQRRHQLRYNINMAGSHPRMEIPFVVESIKGGNLEVRTPQLAISKCKLTDRLETLCVTKRRQLAYLMQSADWSGLPQHERIVAETLYDDIDMFQQKIELEATCLNGKFAKLESKLRRAVESGRIKPQNGGIRGLISPNEKAK